MKVLIILISNELDLIYKNNIVILKNLIKQSLPNYIIDFAVISSYNDFCNYENIIPIKYKIINTKRQLNKICDFISDYKYNFDYKWYIKFRPDHKLLESINFDLLDENSINCRARVYIGPKKVINGNTCGGKGKWNTIKSCKFSENEETFIIEDTIWIFHNNVINMGGFDKLKSKFPSHKQDNYSIGYEETFDENNEPEWKYTVLFKSRNIKFNLIGINVLNEKHNTLSGNINI